MPVESVPIHTKSTVNRSQNFHCHLLVDPVEQRSAKAPSKAHGTCVATNPQPNKKAAHEVGKVTKLIPREFLENMY
jgi:hypothetical protein